MFLVGALGFATACATSAPGPLAPAAGPASSFLLAPVSQTAPTQPVPAASGIATASPPEPATQQCVDLAGRRWEQPRSSDTLTVPSPSATPASGKINAANRVVASARGDVRACFQAALNKDPDVGGRITFTAHVPTAGGVDYVCLGPVGTIAQTSAIPCITDVLLRLRFDPPEGSPAGAAHAIVSGSFSFINSNRQPPAPAAPRPAAGDDTQSM